MTEKDIIDIIFKLRSDVWEIWGFSSVIGVAAIGWLISTKGLKTRAQKLLASLLYTSFYLTMVGSFYKSYRELEMAISDLGQFAIKKELDYQGGLIHHFYHIDYFDNFYYALTSNSLLAIMFLYCVWAKVLQNL